MAIPITQLETWAKQGSITQSSTTYATIKNALESNEAAYAGKDYKVFLQGSYCNDTNIWSESDVDIVMRLDSTFQYDIDGLSDAEKNLFNAAFTGGASYGYGTFKDDVTKRLKARFGEDTKPGTKAIKIKENGGRRNADVVVALQFRRYQNFFSFLNQRYVSGICFFTPTWDKIINYPKQHSDNCTTKHQATKSCFKPMVRILKNARVKLANDGKIDSLAVAPSYFLEGLMYNVPNHLFTGSYQDMIVAAFNWIVEQDRSKFVTANEQFYLLGNSAVTWPAANCDAFLNAFIDLYNNWK
jgi:hypothetical protein